MREEIKELRAQLKELEARLGELPGVRASVGRNVRPSAGATSPEQVRAGELGT